MEAIKVKICELYLILMAANDNNVIALKLDQMYEKQERMEGKISMLTERVLHPEDGIFAKVKTASFDVSKNKEDINNIYKNIDKLLAVCEANQNSVITIENWIKNHEERDNELRNTIKSLAEAIKQYASDKDEELDPLKKDYDLRMSTKIWKDRLIWLIISGLVVAIAIPPLKKLIKDDYATKPKVEEKTSSKK